MLLKTEVMSRISLFLISRDSYLLKKQETFGAFLQPEIVLTHIHDTEKTNHLKTNNHSSLFCSEWEIISNSVFQVTINS